jgi:TRAP transporter TAXI family solute receptor
MATRHGNPRSKPFGSRIGLGLFGTALVLVGLGFGVAIQFLKPAPPRHIVMLTGESGGAYDIIGRRYAEVLAQYGVELEVRHTAGSLENLELLQSGEGDLALMQGGLIDEHTASGLYSIGSVFFEPIWIFHRANIKPKLLTDLRGLRVSVGLPDSGTEDVATVGFQLNRMSDEVETRNLPVDAVETAFREGEIDAAFLSASVTSPIVRGLLMAEGIDLMSMQRAEAYARLDASLTRLVLPQGVVDLANNLPAEDKQLIATAANLVTRQDFHPALVDLVLIAATEVNGGVGVFANQGDFPTARYTGVRFLSEARRFYDYGPPFLLRYLPFWAATQLDRLKVLLLPLLVLAIPIFRALPPTYRWGSRKRIYRWYRRLRALETELHAGIDRETLKHASDELDRIEEDVARVATPLSYAAELYDLRLHIEYIGRRIDSLAEFVEESEGDDEGEQRHNTN